MASFMLSFFPLDVLDDIWDLIESVSEGFLTYSSYHGYMVWTEKSVMLDHCSASLDKPRDANQCASGQIFLSKPSDAEQ